MYAYIYIYIYILVRDNGDIGPVKSACHTDNLWCIKLNIKMACIYLTTQLSLKWSCWINLHDNRNYRTKS